MLKWLTTDFVSSMKCVRDRYTAPSSIGLRVLYASSMCAQAICVQAMCALLKKARLKQ